MKIKTRTNTSIDKLSGVMIYLYKVHKVNNFSAPGTTYSPYRIPTCTASSTNFLYVFSCRLNLSTAM